MGDLLGSFLESMRVRSKHAEKTRVGLWGQSIILKAVWGVTNGIRARPLPVRCGSRTNHAEAGGHVTLEAEEGEGWLHRMEHLWSPHRNERDPEAVQV